MAASTDVMNATDVIIQISEDGGTTYDTIGNCTACSLTASMDTRDITTKGSSAWRELLGGLKSWNVSGEGLVTYNAVSDVDKPNDMFTLLSARTKVTVKFGSLTVYEFDYTGSAYLTSYEQEAGTEENNTFSFSFEGTGALVQAVVA